LPKAKSAAEKALQLDPDLSEAHVALGAVLENFDFDYSASEREFKRAIELSPNSSYAHQSYADDLANLGRANEAISEIKLAQQLDPVSFWVSRDVGRIFYEARQYDEALGALREAAEMKSKLEEYQRQEKQRETERLTAEENQRVQQALQTIKAQISEAMTEAGVPLDSKIAPQLAKRVAQVMQLGYVNGKVITPKEAMARVKQELSEYQKAYYDVLDEDKLVEQLGKENAEKVRKYYLKAVKESEKKDKKDFKSSPKRDERKTMTPDEFRDYLDGLKKGK